MCLEPSVAANLAPLKRGRLIKEATFYLKSWSPFKIPSRRLHKHAIPPCATRQRAWESWRPMAALELTLFTVSPEALDGDGRFDGVSGLSASRDPCLIPSFGPALLFERPIAWSLFTVSPRTSSLVRPSWSRTLTSLRFLSGLDPIIWTGAPFLSMGSMGF